MRLLHTKFGVVHGTRPNGGLICKNEIRAVKFTEGDWDEVTCTVCLQKRATGVRRKRIKEDEHV